MLSAKWINMARSSQNVKNILPPYFCTKTTQMSGSELNRCLLAGTVWGARLRVFPEMPGTGIGEWVGGWGIKGNWR